MPQEEPGIVIDQILKHPLIVHVPLVLIPVAVLLTALDFARPRYGLRYVALALLCIGVAGAVLAAATGENAEHQAEQVMPTVASIRAAGGVPRAIAGGSLLETHAKLGELTRNVYALLLVTEAGLIVVTAPAFAGLRRGRAVPARLARLGRGLWLLAAVAGLALIVLTGHYGGSLVYNHGVGVARSGSMAFTP